MSNMLRAVLVTFVFFVTSLSCVCSAPLPNVLENRELWELRFEIHQQVEAALLTPVNLFILQETFFPREENVSPPVSVTVTFNVVTSRRSRNGSNSFLCSGEERENVDCRGAFSFLWSQLPLPRVRDDCYSFDFLTSYSQSGETIVLPHIQLMLQVDSDGLPEGTTEPLFHNELYGITKKLRMYALPSILPAQHNTSTSSLIQNLIQSKSSETKYRYFAASLDSFPCVTSPKGGFIVFSIALQGFLLCLHFIFFLANLSLGRATYRILYSNIRGKKNPVYAIYWCILMLSLILIYGNLPYYELLTKPNLLFVPFVILEFFVALFVVFDLKRRETGRFPFKIIARFTDFPIPFCLKVLDRNEEGIGRENEEGIGRENEEGNGRENEEGIGREQNCFEKLLPPFKDHVLKPIKYFVQFATLWIMIVAVHVFIFPLVDKIVLLFETPLEALIEFLIIITISYVLIFIGSLCFFYVNPIVFVCCDCKDFFRPKNCARSLCSIVQVLAVSVAFATMIIVGFTAKSLAILFSNQQDSDGLALFVVLTPASFAFIIAVLTIDRKKVSKGATNFFCKKVENDEERHGRMRNQAMQYTDTF